MTWTVVILFGVAGVALAATALFSAAEVAMFSIRSSALNVLKEKGNPKVAHLEDVLQNPRRYLVAILFGSVFSSVLLGFSVVWICENLGGSHAAWGWLFPLGVTLILLLFIGELIPKALATQRRKAVALGLVLSIRKFEQLVHPLTGLFDRISQQWATRMVPPSNWTAGGLTGDEYLTLLDIGTREGNLRPAEKKLIERTIKLSDRNIREIMTPRSEMCCVDVDLSLDEMKKEAARLRHRRLPIYTESLDSIVGVLNTRCFLGPADADMMAWIEPPSFIPETMMALDLLKNFIKSRQHMALVVDEFGGVEGLVTMEDIVEEIFGEIYDEYEEAIPTMEVLGSNAWRIQGFSHISEVAGQLKLGMDVESIDTMGGWLMHKLESVPSVGDQLDYEGYRFEVEKMRGHRILTVLCWPSRRERP